MVVDTEAPWVFGLAAPASELWLPGVEIGVRFSEPISCSKPFSFSVAMEVTDPAQGGAVQARYGLPAIDAQCERGDKQLALAFPAGVRFEQLMGMHVEVVVENVVDLAGNPVQRTLAWKFDVVAPAAEDLVVPATGLRVDGVPNPGNGSYPLGSELY